MNLLILSALVSAILAGGGAWKIQSWRMDAKEKERVQELLEQEREDAAQALAAQRDLRALENRRNTVAASAQAAAVGRDIDLRRSADGSRVALVSLHDATATALREADASHAACTARAAAIGGLLDASTKEYRDLGEKAARHVSDIQTLIDTWPKE